VWLAGVGFFADAYDLFVTNLILVILDAIYSAKPSDLALVSSAGLAGTIVGQIGFGFLGDFIGTTTAWILTVCLIILGCLFSAFLSFGSFVFVLLSFWRFILGLGIGGEYPLAATVSREASHESHGVSRVALVFSAQGWGNLAAPLVILILISILPETSLGLQLVWRLAVLFGVIPCIYVFLGRLRVFNQAQGGSNERITPSWDFVQTSVQQNLWRLLWTAGTWFIFDVVFYANGLFSATVLSLLKFETNQGIHGKLKDLSIESLCIAGMGLPGYFLAVYIIDRVGKVNLQRAGFLILSFIYLLMGIFLDSLEKHRLLFICLYGLTFFVSNMGPNTTTFVIPTEAFPSESRATCHGISAASGKLGAVFGSVMFPLVLHTENGIRWGLICCGIICLGGYALSSTTWISNSPINVHSKLEEEELSLQDLSPSDDQPLQI
jgi:PHS family inorganic phosphate transporter-like MFS transporter